MSTPDGEPMFPANEAMHEAESRERLIAWDVPRVAADTEAMKAALKEYIVRLMFEHGSKAFAVARRLYNDALLDALKEFQAAPIIKESEAPF